jgi:hypothetical protein
LWFALLTNSSEFHLYSYAYDLSAGLVAALLVISVRRLVVSTAGTSAVRDGLG